MNHSNVTNSFWGIWSGLHLFATFFFHYHFQLVKGNFSKNLGGCSPQKQSYRGVPWKGVLKNLAKFTRKHLYRSLFLSAAGSFINKETPAQCFPMPLTIFRKKLHHRCLTGFYIRLCITSLLKYIECQRNSLQRLFSVKVSDKNGFRVILPQ